MAMVLMMLTVVVMMRYGHVPQIFNIIRDNIEIIFLCVPKDVIHGRGLLICVFLRGETDKLLMGKNRNENKKG